MVICFCLNNLGSFGLGATINSLIQNCSDSSKLHLYFLCSSVNKNIKNGINKLLQKTGFTGQFDFVDFNAFREFHIYRPLHDDWTPYGKLLIADLIHADRVLYLDCDLIIETDILKLSNVYFEDFGIGAVGSGSLQFTLENKFFLNTLKLAGNVKTFNSGVLLINILIWKQEKIKEKLLGIANKYPNQLLAADQTLLNAYFLDNFFDLPSKYNTSWEAAENPDIDSDIIYHFVGSPKPWDFFGRYLHSGYIKWQQYNSGNWNKDVLGKFWLLKLKRFWAIKRSYIKLLLKK